MLAIKQILLDLSTTLLAFSIGVLVFKRLERFYRLLFFQVFTYLLVDGIALTIPFNNGWLFNAFIPIETALLLLAAQAYYNTSKSKQLLLILFGFFLMVFLADIFFFTGIIHFAYHAAIAEGILLTCVYITVLYFQLMKKMDNSNIALVMASIGMVLYFACSVPYLCVLFYFQTLDPIFNQKLFQNIIVVLAIVRYFFIAIAFFIVKRKQEVNYFN